MSLTIDDREIAALRQSGSKVKVDAWNKPAPPKAPEKTGNEQVLSAIANLLEKLPAMLKQEEKAEAPKITVNVPETRVMVNTPEIRLPEQPAPIIHVESAQTAVNTPTAWMVEVTRRDGNNLIKSMTIKAVQP